MSNSNEHRIAQLESDIQMKRQQPMAWPVLGAKLAELKKLGYGKNKVGKEHWIEKLVKPINLKRTSAWRFMSLAIKWEDISQHLMDLKLIKSANFEDLDPKISAEQLEILYKIILVSDVETWKPIATKTINKEMTLREIRRHWNHLRPVMMNNSGRTRWSNDLTAVNNARRQKKEIDEIFLTTKAYKTIQEQYPQILKNITQIDLFKYSLLTLAPKPYKIGSNEKGDILKKDIFINAASIIQYANSDMAVIHGFIIDNGASIHTIDKKIEKSLELVDFLWIITEKIIEIKYENIGLIHYETDKSIIIELKDSLLLKEQRIIKNELLRVMILSGKEYANTNNDKPKYTLIHV